MAQFTKEDILREITEITELYNMGFLTEKEYFCQRAHVLYPRLVWMILCIIPSSIYSLYMKLF